MRHGPTALDEQMIDALHIYHRHWIAILTKADKLNTSEYSKALRQCKKQLTERGALTVIPYSSPTHDGREALWTTLLAQLKTAK
jgi:GTP-binding protein EngB required for normal cell division